MINKLVREQLRSPWMLLMTILSAPLFVFIYYVVVESSQSTYTVAIYSSDNGIYLKKEEHAVNYTDSLMEYMNAHSEVVRVEPVRDTANIKQLIQENKIDIYVLLPDDFSSRIKGINLGIRINIPIEFTGNLTSLNYMIAAIWSHSLISDFIFENSLRKNPILFQESGIGLTDSKNDFDMQIPGLLVFAIIILLFTASVAFVRDAELGAFVRLRLARINVISYVGAIFLVQMLIGLISLLLSVGVAMVLGFDMQSKLLPLMAVSGVTAISIISFSLLIAAISKTSVRVIVVGIFPLLLFMFFTGVLFPVRSLYLFDFLSMPIHLNAALSPTFAVNALNKILIFNEGLAAVLPEIGAMLVLSLVYFLVGLGLYRKRIVR